jgi:two-component system, sensor histidine kinase
MLVAPTWGVVGGCRVLSGIMERPAACFTGRVLLVEDNRINRLIAGELLEQIGVEVEFAEDGAEALEKLDAGKFDLVLMDCVMPRMDGYEATQRLRERERSSGGGRTPVVAVTANATADDRAHCLQAGMDDFLPKPIILDTLVRVIAQYLRTA